MDKGVALTEVRPRARARRRSLYAGDDLGDLAAFAAVEKRCARTAVPGLLVCSGSRGRRSWRHAPTSGVPGPAGVADCLAAVARTVSAG